jgi:hypothetical protein
MPRLVKTCVHINWALGMAPPQQHGRGSNILLELVRLMGNDFEPLSA